MKTFESLEIPKSILDSLAKLNFSEMTPIQEAVIPAALTGRDILGNAQTGTGKTAAFAIPAINFLINNPNNSVLVLLPTRELADQVLTEIKKMMGANKIPTALLIGGDSVSKQLNQLKAHPRIIVGTPGRIYDHLTRRVLKLSNTNFLVLDETDRMLDMGFVKQLEKIAEYLPETRQTIMLSATFPKNIMTLAEKYLNNPMRISIGEQNNVAENITQELIHTTDEKKYEVLLGLLDGRSGSVLVFVKTKHGADRLANRLSVAKFPVDTLHGGLAQGRRERVIRDFRNKKISILIATDIAARGLDISHIETVINFDMPMASEDYIHRIGRTARAGASGTAINLLTAKDHGLWRDICKLLKTSNELGPEPENRKKPTENKRWRPRTPKNNVRQRSGGSRQPKRR